MDAKQVLRADFDRSRMVTNMLLADLSDSDLMVRTVEGANHSAWQLGHLIASEHSMGEMIKPGSMPALPDGFKEKHSKETASNDNAADFLTKDEYLKMLEVQRQGILAVLDGMTDEEFDKPAPEGWQRIAPTLGDVLGLAASHEMMHSGQLTPLRRKLGKPVVF
jgi:uncharacterized damage-inducible protein DinB